MLTVGLIMAAFYAVLSSARGSFDVEELKSNSLRKPLVRWFLALMFFGVVSFSFKIGHSFSRGGVLTGLLLGAAAIAALRSAAPYTVNMALRHHVLAGRRAILLTDGPLPASMPLSELTQQGIAVHGWFQLPLATDSERANEILKQCGDVVRLARERSIQDIVIIADAFQETRFSEAMQLLRVLPLRVLLLPRSHTVGAAMRPPRGNDLAKMALTVQSPPFSRAEHRAKRLVDIAFATAAIVVASPVLALIALAIRMDSRGPVLFRQTRIGFCGRPFMIFKFRSMYTTDNGPIVKQAQRGDLRITRVGRFLRQTSLDELPQLINVVMGDMSLVGPRPHAAAHDRHYAPIVSGYEWRCHAIPGITGWAQVNGFRGETRELATMEARVAHDLWYIRNWSLWLDVKILFMTVRAVLKPTNAF